MVLAFVVLASVAQVDMSADALARVEESLVVLGENDPRALESLRPILVVSTRPFFEATRTWYPGEAMATLGRVFEPTALRVCEACQVPRTFVESGLLLQATGPLGLEELRALDARTRGDQSPAKTAVWLDETGTGVSYRFVSLEDGHVELAANVDPTMGEKVRTIGTVNLAKEAERRARGESLTHGVADFALFPRQHISLEWVDQWGATNRNLSGFVISLIDPVLGVGGAYHRIFPEVGNLSVGGKVVLSVPTGFAESISDDIDEDLIDRLITGVFIARLPVFDSNYAINATVSTNGTVGIGISLLNSSFLPFLL